MNCFSNSVTKIWNLLEITQLSCILLFSSVEQYGNSASLSRFCVWKHFENDKVLYRFITWRVEKSNGFFKLRTEWWVKNILPSTKSLRWVKNVLPSTKSLSFFKIQLPRETHMVALIWLTIKISLFEKKLSWFWWFV